MFFGNISEKVKIAMVSNAGKAYFEYMSDWKYFDKCVANKMPARVAPKVFAIVFKERIAELVRSICFTNKSKSSPLLLDTFLSCSISEGFVLKTIASKSEQKADTARVKKTVNMKYIIY